MTDRKMEKSDIDKGQGWKYLEEDVINLRGFFRVLKANFWRICAISIGAGILAFLILLTRPNYYRSTAVIMPVEDDYKKSGPLGALASLSLLVGGPTKVEDLEVLFKSDDLTVRVFTRHEHWETLLGDSYDPTTKQVKPGLLSFLSSGRKKPSPPSEWDAIRAAKDARSISLNRKAGTLTVSFETTSPEESAAILVEYLDEAKSRLQEEAFARAGKNKIFIENQISKTTDPLTRDRLYALYGQEVEREMMARNREQFGFRVIDAPRVPDRKSWPLRFYGTVAVIFLTFFGICGFFLLRSYRP